MPSTEAVVQILWQVIDDISDESILAVYLFGSTLVDSARAHDVDVAVVWADSARGQPSHISALSRRLAKRFSALTGKFLDQTRLFEDEVADTPFLMDVGARLIWQEGRRLAWR
jgi:predicted nucleotidyltransferase